MAAAPAWRLGAKRPERGGDGTPEERAEGGDRDEQQGDRPLTLQQRMAQLI